MDKKKLAFVLLGFSLLLIGALIYFSLQEKSIITSAIPDEEETAPVEVVSGLSVSVDSGYFDEDISVELAASSEYGKEAVIYYTLDGNDPDTKSKKYKSALELKCKKGISVYPLKAAVYVGEVKQCDIVEKTYIISENLDLGLDIAVITCDDDCLYDYETGILVGGKTYDDNVEAGASGYIGGNYNNRGDDWIRPAHISMINADGSLMLDQKVGVGVSGGTSSRFDVKSLKIWADEAYDPDYDKLAFMFNGDEEFLPQSYISRYNSLRFRSGSQDQESANIRSSVVSRLAAQNNFDGCTSAHRCIVYLNDKFYGIFDMQQNYSQSFIADKYGFEDSLSVLKYKGNDKDTLSASGMMEYLTKNLNVEANRRELESVVDMDSFLQYYALNVMFNNTDWPVNNYEIWRYTGEYDSSNKYTDGRYRFLIYDTDLVFNSESTPNFFAGCKEDIFQMLMDRSYRINTDVFYNVMKSEYYRNKFITILCNISAMSFSEENISDIICGENELLTAAREYYYDKEFSKKADSFAEDMIGAALERPAEIDIDMDMYFGLKDKYQLNIKCPEGIMVSFENVQLYQNEEFAGDYYCGVKFTINADTYPGYEFKYWVANGTIYNDSSLAIDKFMTENGHLYILPVVEKTEGAFPVISEIYTKGEGDWIRITNMGSETARLRNYYISDSDEKPMKFQLPNIELKSGQSVIINGSKNYYELGDYICNFSLTSGETLYLSFGENTVDSINIPKMDIIESYGRFDGSNIWVFYNNKNNMRRGTDIIS